MDFTLSTNQHYPDSDNSFIAHARIHELKMNPGQNDFNLV